MAILPLFPEAQARGYCKKPFGGELSEDLFGAVESPNPGRDFLGKGQRGQEQGEVRELSRPATGPGPVAGLSCVCGPGF